MPNLATSMTRTPHARVFPSVLFMGALAADLRHVLRDGTSQATTLTHRPEHLASSERLLRRVVHPESHEHVAMVEAASHHRGLSEGPDGARGRTSGSEGETVASDGQKGVAETIGASDARKASSIAGERPGATIHGTIRLQSLRSEYYLHVNTLADDSVFATDSEDDGSRWDVETIGSQGGLQQVKLKNQKSVDYLVVRLRSRNMVFHDDSKSSGGHWFVTQAAADVVTFRSAVTGKYLGIRVQEAANNSKVYQTFTNLTEGSRWMVRQVSD
mmetsp:Transcript_87732/g.246495  ORF Transcript_87732/g.246495 Transcript_87732/m.246495 type:complete len:272 (-) Transcript_87732:197-1012(-)